MALGQLLQIVDITPEVAATRWQAVVGKNR
jgi:hypothetical protein